MKNIDDHTSTKLRPNNSSRWIQGPNFLQPPPKVWLQDVIEKKHLNFDFLEERSMYVQTCVNTPHSRTV